MEYKLESKGDNLFVNVFGKLKKVIKGWESFSGWYWFAFEIDHKQDSDLGDGKVFKNDIIYYGLVQGAEEELGYFALSDLKGLIDKNMAWPIPQKNLSFSGRRH